MFKKGRNESGNQLAKRSACLASRACALGPQPRSIAGILNLAWLNAVPSVCTSGPSVNTEVLDMDGVVHDAGAEMLGQDWANQAPLRCCSVKTWIILGKQQSCCVGACEATRVNHCEGKGWVECLQPARSHIAPTDNPGLRFS